MLHCNTFTRTRATRFVSWVSATGRPKMGTHSISCLLSPPGCTSLSHSGPGGTKSPFHPLFFLTGNISCTLGSSDMTGEDENTRIIHWRLLTAFPPPFHKFFLLPCVSRQSIHNAKIGKKKKTKKTTMKQKHEISSIPS